MDKRDRESRGDMRIHYIYIDDIIIITGPPIIFVIPWPRPIFLMLSEDYPNHCAHNTNPAKTGKTH